MLTHQDLMLQVTYASVKVDNKDQGIVDTFTFSGTRYSTNFGPGQWTVVVR